MDCLSYKGEGSGKGEKVKKEKGEEGRKEGRRRGIGGERSKGKGIRKEERIWKPGMRGKRSGVKRVQWVRLTVDGGGGSSVDLKTAPGQE